MILVLSQDGASAINPFNVPAWNTESEETTHRLVAVIPGGNAVPVFCSADQKDIEAARVWLWRELEDVTANWDRSRRTIDLAEWARGYLQKKAERTQIQDIVAAIPLTPLAELEVDARMAGARIQLPSELRPVMLRAFAAMVLKDGIPRRVGQGRTRAWLCELLGRYGIEVNS